MFRVLARSRSWRFTNDMRRPEKMLDPSATPSLGRLNWYGHDVFYRSGTRDPFAIYQVLLRPGPKAEYYVPPTLKPKMIVDIGSNIGSSIIYFHQQFPDAKILGFEPHPDTFRVLEKNVADLNGVKVFNYGLGATNQRIAKPVPCDYSLRRVIVALPNSRLLQPLRLCRGEACLRKSLRRI